LLIVQRTRVLSVVTYKMALGSAAHFIHKEYIFSAEKRKTLTATICMRRAGTWWILREQ